LKGIIDSNKSIGHLEGVRYLGSHLGSQAY